MCHSISLILTYDKKDFIDLKASLISMSVNEPKLKSCRI